MILRSCYVWEPLNCTIKYFYTSQRKFSNNFFLIKDYSIVDISGGDET